MKAVHSQMPCFRRYILTVLNIYLFVATNNSEWLADRRIINFKRFGRKRFFKLLFENLLGGPRKTTKSISQNIRCTAQRSSRSLPGQNSETLSLDSCCSVEMECKIWHNTVIKVVFFSCQRTEPNRLRNLHCGASRFNYRPGHLQLWN
jgi:hypothetical protein